MDYELLSYELHSIQGDLLPVPVKVGATMTTLDLGELSSGLYILRVYNGSFAKTIKIVLE